MKYSICFGGNGGMMETVFCGVCVDDIPVSELRVRTGDDGKHYSCPGCGCDLLPVEQPEQEAPL